MDNQVNKILFITLSNIGDCILTMPVLDSLRSLFPHASVTVMVGPRPKELFQNNPAVQRIIVYEKRATLGQKRRLFAELKRERFDLIIDLRNTLFGAFLPAPCKTPFFLTVPRNIRHMRDRHLYRAQAALRTINKELPLVSNRSSLAIDPKDEVYIDDILKENKLSRLDKIIILAPGARSTTKRWPTEKFIQLTRELLSRGYKVMLVGDKADAQIADYMQAQGIFGIVNMCAKTTLAQLAVLLEKASLVITNDSAVLHLASYCGIALVALFGPTDDTKYAPWSPRCAVVKKDIFCRPCAKAQCRFKTLACLQMIKVEDVLRQVDDLINSKSKVVPPSDIIGGRDPALNRMSSGKNSKQIQSQKVKEDYKRILIVRTDRIGDVLLSTPVIKVLRDAYPSAYIAMMVAPYAKDIVEGNPCLDEIIVYDKEGKHKSWWRSMKFARNLKKKKFDIAFILHPTNRVHLVTFFARIRQRVGYDRKFGFLLTDRLAHNKQLGQKHEAEYNFDLLRHVGIQPQEKVLFMPLRQDAEAWIEDLLKREGVAQTDKLVAIHPGASCPSKIWPNQRFAQVADRLAEKYGYRVFVIAGPKDIALAEQVVKHMHNRAINLAGKTSVSQLASLLKRCRLFISNDSGPVHLASAMGTPVVSIFGRNQAGLSPKRWGPLGTKDRFLHKQIGCIECLAHNCRKEFACLRSIQVDDVIGAVESIWNSREE